MEPIPTPSINLAGGDDLAARPGGKFVHWALTWGKVVIVITELVVVSAFISRFYLDSVIADLNETVERKKGIVTASADFEKRYRALVARIQAASEIVEAVAPDVVLARTKELLPEGIEIDSISLDVLEVSLQGSSATEEALAVLSRSFKESSRFTNVVLQRVSKGAAPSGGEAKIVFSLSAKFVGQN